MKEPTMTGRRFFLAVCMFVTLTVPPRAQAPAAQSDGRDVDRAAIRAHIESICQAFLDGDAEKIRATHTDDWRGFLDSPGPPIKGIDEYMRANGIQWPPPAGAPKRAWDPNPNGAFKVFDFDVHFYSPDLAVANFFVDFGRKSGSEFTTGNRFRIMDVYARRNGQWIQAASHTVVDPAWRAEQMAQPGTLSPPEKQQLLAARESVWRSFFTNDRAQLDKLVPADTIVLEGPLEAPFVKKAQILDEAGHVADGGLKLVRLEFPQTEIQVYGPTAIIYTTYLFELENAQGHRETTTGKATEIFVRRNGAWVNPGWHLASVTK
jgi:uncharacterized protein DUF4440